MLQRKNLRIWCLLMKKIKYNLYGQWQKSNHMYKRSALYDSAFLVAFVSYILLKIPGSGDVCFAYECTSCLAWGNDSRDCLGGCAWHPWTVWFSRSSLFYNVFNFELYVHLSSKSICLWYGVMWWIVFHYKIK